MVSCKKTIYIVIGFIAFFAWHNSASAATEFVSTIKQTGGDYSTLVTWEAAIQCDLTASTTVVYSGTGTGALSAASTVELFRSGVYQNVTARVIATSSSQILVQTFTGDYKVLQDGDQWRKASSTANMWTISGSGNQLGDSASAVAKIDQVFTETINSGGSLDINGWTVATSTYIKIYTTANARHKGRKGTGYKLNTTSSSYGIIAREANVWIDGLEIVGGSNSAFYNEGAGEKKISNCLIYSSGTTISINANSMWQIWNNIIYTFSFGMYAFSGNNTAYIYNNTIFYIGSYPNTKTAIYGGTGTRAKNNIACGFGGQSGYSEFTGNFHADSDYNISCKDTSSPGSHSKDNITPNFASIAGKDYRLAVSDRAARDAGTDLSGDSSIAFTNDIDSEQRPYGAAWDIGADELYGVTQINSPQTNVLNDDGLVGYWSFNGQDMGTTSARDLSGNNNTGWLFNGTKKVSGISEQALSFDNVNDYIQMPYSSVLDLSNNSGSIMVWIYPTSELGQDVFEPLIRRPPHSNPTAQGGYALGVYQGGPTASHYLRLYIGASENFDSFIDNQIPIITNKWQYVGVTWASSTVSFYVNGVHASDGSRVKPIIYTDNVGVRVGKNNTMYYQGFIDEPRIYNRILSAEEIGELYRAGAKKMQVNAPQTNLMADDGLVGYWSFNGQDMNWASTTAEALDRSGNSNNGNVINGAKPVSGISGQAMQFDGVDDYVSIDGNVSLNLDTAFSFTAWIRRASGYTGYDGIYGSGTQANDWEVLIYNNHYLTFIERAVAAYQSTAIINDTNWHFIAVIKNGDSGTNLSFYMDGVSAGTGSCGTVTTPSGIKKIGWEAGGGEYFQGNIDEVRVYNRALSADEIGELYRAGARKVRY